MGIKSTSGPFHKGVYVLAEETTYTYPGINNLDAG